MALELQHSEPPLPANPNVGVDGDAGARAAELVDLAEDDRRRQELDYAELGGEG